MTPENKKNEKRNRFQRLSAIARVTLVRLVDGGARASGKLFPNEDPLPNCDVLAQHGPTQFLSPNDPDFTDNSDQDLGTGAQTLPGSEQNSLRIRDAANPVIPVWASNSVWYQVYPLGFFDCVLHNGHEEPPEDRISALALWFDYLEELGVGVVLFNPLFESDSHGYDTTDYFKIDRRLGTVDAFRKVVQELHSRNIRVVLDGVFNHTGRNHAAFLDCREHGLQSEYATWYKLRPGSSPCGDSFEYSAWEGHYGLPELNHDDPGVKQMIFDVARFWLADVGVDGWRLDVAHEISPTFWREFAEVCTAARTDTCLVGELIHGDYRRWVSRDVLHSATNYQLSHSLWHSVVDRNYFEFVHSLQRCQELYGGLHLLEFVGNHDVQRLTSRLQEPGDHVLAHGALLFAAGGMPCLYYGDEYGMKGLGTKDGGALNDADLRKPALAPQQLTAEGQTMIKAVALMLEIRRQYACFQQGRVTVLANSNEQLAVVREDENHIGLVLFNCSAHAVDGFPQYVGLDAASARLLGGKVLQRVLCFSNGRQVQTSGTAAVDKVNQLVVDGGFLPSSMAVYTSTTTKL
ncbi:hypothetical protein CYMTET_13260 [Cymbomonas tetramitiformis]|uniref:Glycosyl hydrolase family 13 catalytic domain-containing protein n=1 Tax=Cymbomonas tetramitiformis TaxID=36881 RepID=A0AAE0GIH8_9CHLO|nr:hypothetical protein CYMTET_13260 [Cymbomonas tetramitiformis]